MGGCDNLIGPLLNDPAVYKNREMFMDRLLEARDALRNSSPECKKAFIKSPIREDLPCEHTFPYNDYTGSKTFDCETKIFVTEHLGDGERPEHDEGVLGQGEQSTGLQRRTITWHLTQSGLMIRYQ